MPKSRKLESLLAQLQQIRPNPTTSEALLLLRELLTSKQPVAIAQAATLIAEAEHYDLIPDLVATFEWAMTKPSERDPGCIAKLKLADALYRLEYSNEDLFLQGIRYAGISGDRTAPLRSVCALGLVRMNYPDVMSELADLLADPESDARIGAARAIAYTGNLSGVPLLRLRIKLGDIAPVLFECFLALLQLYPMQSSIDLVRSFLVIPSQAKARESTDIVEAAALAFGESRLSEAFDILQTWWVSADLPEHRKIGSIAISLLRNDEAFSFLLSLIQRGTLADAKDSIAALSVYRENQALWQLVRERIEQRGDSNLLSMAN
jgi:HEAT repeat protein